MGGDLRENGSEYTGINEGQQSQEGGGLCWDSSPTVLLPDVGHSKIFLLTGIFI